MGRRSSIQTMGMMKFRSSVTRYTCFSRKIASRSFSDSITPMTIRDMGVIMVPILLITVCTGAGQCRPRASIKISTKVVMVGTVKTDLTLTFSPVNIGSCTTKKITLKAISPAALNSTAIWPNRARHRGRPRKVRLGKETRLAMATPSRRSTFSPLRTARHTSWVPPITANMTTKAMPRLRKPSAPRSMLVADKMVKGSIRSEHSRVRNFRCSGLTTPSLPAAKPTIT